MHLLGAGAAQKRLVLLALVVLGVVARLPAAKPDVGLLLVAGKVLVAAEPRAVVAHLHGRLLGDVLEGVRLDELANPQATRVTARRLRRECVVRANDLVTVGHIGLHTQEEAAIVLQIFLEETPVPVHHLHMLASNLIRQLQHLLVIVHNNDLTVVPPRSRSGLHCGDALELLLYLGNGLPGQALGRGHEHGRRVVAVLRLAEQVRSRDLGIHGVVAEQQRLGGAGKEIDAHLAEDLLLGLGDKGIAGAGDEVHRLDGLRAVGHGCDRLGAAHKVDAVGAGQVHGGDGRVRHAARLAAGHGRGAGDDALAAGDLGREHGHVRRGDHRELSARDVAAHVLDGDVLVAKGDARLRLDLDVLHGVSLKLGEAPDV
mmetsp:Transcript_39479/g.112730  ORF Transcript_39479/g.112730 Transcript_39479/m.112730 type:complete len:372 (+) Transcript_39479:46-1161(+)